MGARQVSSADEEFAHNLGPGEFEIGAEQFNPTLKLRRMMQIKPCLERPFVGSNIKQSAGILDRCVYFEAIANDTSICQKAGAGVLIISRDRSNIETVIGGGEIVLLF